MKKLISAALGAGMLLVTVSPIFAKVTVKLTDTGPLSNNNVWTNQASNLAVGNTNNAMVTNRTISVSNTGLNLNILNTKVLGTGGNGKAKSKVEIGNSVNNTATVINECSTCDEDTTVELDQTGPLSNNVVGVTTNKNISVSNVNNAIVTNEVISVANSGLNVSLGNTKVEGTGSTGDAKSVVGILNNVNSSQTYINAVPVVASN